MVFINSATVHFLNWSSSKLVPTSSLWSTFCCNVRWSGDSWRKSGRHPYSRPRRTESDSTASICRRKKSDHFRNLVQVDWKNNMRWWYIRNVIFKGIAYELNTLVYLYVMESKLSRNWMLSQSATFDEWRYWEYWELGQFDVYITFFKNKVKKLSLVN